MTMVFDDVDRWHRFRDCILQVELHGVVMSSEPVDIVVDAGGIISAVADITSVIIADDWEASEGSQDIREKMVFRAARAAIKARPEEWNAMLQRASDFDDWNRIESGTFREEPYDTPIRISGSVG